MEQNVRVINQTIEDVCENLRDPVGLRSENDYELRSTIASLVNDRDRLLGSAALFPMQPEMIQVGTEATESTPVETAHFDYQPLINQENMSNV